MDDAASLRGAVAGSSAVFALTNCEFSDGWNDEDVWTLNSY